MTLSATKSVLEAVNYSDRIAGVHAALGIPLDYAGRSKLPLHPEATELVETDADLAGRGRWLVPEADRAWRTLKAAAAEADHALQLVSAFRSVEYQSGIIGRKRARGLSWEEIFRWSAAPGYSEHHTGRAVDVSTPGSPPLQVEFAATRAYEWLVLNAPALGWRLSFPSDNPHGIAYEPWHWLFIAPTGH